jgi:glucokinase
MILCGDIGATKTQMGLYRYRDDTLELEHSSAFTSSAYAGLTGIIEAFLGSLGITVVHHNILCFINVRRLHNLSGPTRSAETGCPDF